MPDHFSDVLVRASVPAAPQLATVQKWFVVGFLQNSTDLGFPCRRRRSWRNAVNQDRMLWLGPREPARIQEHFNSFFRKSVEMDVDSLLISSDSTRRSYVQALARTRGHFFRDGEPVELKATMTELSWKRFQQFKIAYQGYKVKVLSRSPAAPAAFVGDFSQNIHARKRVGSVLPSITTSTTMYSFSQDKLFTPEEILFSQGFPAAACQDFGHLLPFDRARLDHQQERHLMGNGMHLSQVACNFLYTLINMVRLEDAMDMWPITPLPLPCEDKPLTVQEALEHPDQQQKPNELLTAAGGGSDASE